MHGKKGNDLNAGKNLLFTGNNGEVVLQNSVNQGAGYLQFAGDVRPERPDMDGGRDYHR